MPQAVGDPVRLFRILGEQNRFAILSLLDERGPLCVTDVGRELGISVANASHHLLVMEEAGLVSCSPEGRCRVYSIADDQARRLMRVASDRS